jgi:hypothetical protein
MRLCAPGHGTAHDLLPALDTHSPHTHTPDPHTFAPLLQVDGEELSALLEEADKCDRKMKGTLAQSENAGDSMSLADPDDLVDPETPMAGV